MSDLNNNDTISFDLPKNQSSVIKVIGVGGGGSNAVNHMFGMGIRGVDFAVCNTDAQALSNSPVPNKIQLGVTLTEGLGAGANPVVGCESAQESLEEIKQLLEKNTKMVFITAGMGGGTGTGAAPVIAAAAKEMGILTVGIVTMPFQFEGSNRKQQAEKGIEALRSKVDSLIVINNNKLREVYGNLGFKAGFAKADEVLATASRGIAEVITHHYTTNIDLRDAKTVLADSGTAIMGSASSSGESRAIDAISKALDSPLLNDNHIKGAKNVLLLIVSGSEEITIDEIGEINDHIQVEAGGSANIIMGIGEDESLGSDIAVTIVATGFNADQQVQVLGNKPQKVVHTLEDEQAISTSVYNNPPKTVEEDAEEDIIAKEIAKAEARERERDSALQADLFAVNNEEITAETTAIEEENTPEINEESHEEKKVFALEDEAEEEEEISFNIIETEVETTIDIREELIEDPIELKMEAEAEEEVISEEVDEEPIFSIGEEEDSIQFDIQKEENSESEILEVNNSQDVSEVSEPTPSVNEKENLTNSENEVVKYSLEDYLDLEEKLKSASPTASETPSIQTEKNIEAKAKSNAETEDEALNFVVREVKEGSQEKQAEKTQNVSPVNASIQESMRLQGSERREKLKAFNHRFQMHQKSIEDAENIPAYKRQGINIQDGGYSKESKIGRMSIQNDEDGTNLKSNNSFLHDNVD
tara:strand:+ start:85398 stop:87506 length:2109 start_codon:yes stop_codon:yes gene_type:complete